MNVRIIVATVLGCSLIVAACGSDDGAEPVPSDSATQPATESAEEGQLCADVVGGDIEPAGDGTFRISATVSSGDTGWEKYADAWEVRTLDGAVIDVRVLTHPHETEQPFTRSLLSPVTIPGDVDQIILVAHDLVSGFCGETLTLDVPR